MAAIYFKLSPMQETELKTFMKGEGYESKAEFFRFLIKFYKYNKKTDEIELDKSIDRLSETIKKLNKEGKLRKFDKSIKEQLADV